MTDSVDVFVARTASGFTTSFSSRKRARFTSRSSITDSMTKSQSARSAKCVVAETRDDRFGVFGFALALFDLFGERFAMVRASASAVAWLRERTMTVGAGRGRDLGDPAAHDPEPSTPTFWKPMERQ